jgi:hypothetical protein
MEWMLRYRRTLIGAALGAAGGAIYAATVGCATGTCPLTSRPLTAALYFGVVGALALLPPSPRDPDRR